MGSSFNNMSPSLILLVIIVLSSLCQSELQLGCSTNDIYGHCSQIKDSCYTENQDSNVKCPESVHEGLPPNYNNPFDSVCHCGSTGLEKTPSPSKVHVDLRPYNNDYFIANVSWSKVDEAEGYTVTISCRTLGDESNPPSCFGCSCISGSNQTHAIYHLEYSYISGYSTCNTLRYFDVTVRTYPNNRLQTRKGSYWPTNCYNFSDIPINELQRICGPATPAKTKEIITNNQKISHNSTQIELLFQWEEPSDTPPGYPLVYYLFFRYLGITFKVKNTTSIAIGPLDRNFTYAFIFQAYQPYTCSLNRYCHHNYGCSLETRWNYTAPIKISSSVTTSSAIITNSASSSSIVLHRTTPQLTSSNSPIVVTTSKNTGTNQPFTLVASVGGGVVILMIVVIIVSLIMLGIVCTKLRPPRFEPSPLPSPLSSPSPSPFPPSLSPLPPSTSPVSIISTLSFEYLYDALIVDSKETSDEDRQAIMLYLTHKDFLGKNVTVAYLDRHAAITPAEWLQIMDVSRIICVCNEHFYNEWINQTPGTLVAALRVLVTGVLNSQPDRVSLRFVVVLLRSGDERYIPEILNSVKRFLITQTDDLAHFLTNVKEFDLISNSSSTVIK